MYNLLQRKKTFKPNRMYLYVKRKITENSGSPTQFSIAAVYTFLIIMKLKKLFFFFSKFLCYRPTHIFYVNGFMFWCIAFSYQTLCLTIFFLNKRILLRFFISRLFGILILKFKVKIYRKKAERYNYYSYVMVVHKMVLSSVWEIYCLSSCKRRNNVIKVIK